MGISFETEEIARLENVYSIVSFEKDGKPHFIAASEGSKGGLMFSPPDWEITQLWDKPGGAMSALQVPGRGFEFLVIQGFFPVFQAEEAGIYYVRPEEGKKESWKMDRVIDLPFTHRIQIMYADSGNYFVAATICGGKEYEEDWSQPGSVYAGEIPEDPDAKWNLKPILKNIRKNHGMFLKDGETETLFVSGKEGLFSINPPEAPGEGWETRKLLSHEISDMSVYDVDGDGQEEIVTIEPFHGDNLMTYKLNGDEWEEVFRRDINFGHVVWAGNIRGRPAVIAGSRGGKRRLELLRFETEKGDLTLVEEVVLDEGGAPMQIAVVNGQERDLVCASNGNRDQIMLYRIFE